MKVSDGDLKIMDFIERVEIWFKDEFYG